MEKRIIYGLICILIFFNIVQYKQKKKFINQSNQTVLQLSDSVKYYKNNIGTYSASVLALNLEQNQLREIILNQNKELESLSKNYKNLKSITQFKSQIVFDTIIIPFDISHFDSIPKFEYTGNKIDKWFCFDFKINNDSLVLSSFKTWTDAYIISGIKQDWLLGRKSLTTDITFTNPHIVATDLKSIEVTIKDKWYEKWYFWLAAGITSGILIK